MITLKEYFEQARRLMDSPGTLFRRKILIAGRCIEFITPSAELQEQMMPAFSHLPESRAKEVSLTIFYSDTASAGRRLVAPPWNNFNPQGFHPELDQEEYQIFFQPWHRQVYLYSEKENLGIYWVDTVAEIPWWEKSFSFRIILHWWTRNKPLQLVHAGAMAPDTEGGWVITGPSGSGKSTSCMRLLESGARYLGDDYVMVSTDEQPMIYSLYQTAKLEAANIDRNFPHFREFITNPLTYREQKAILHIERSFPGICIHEIPLRGILLPKISGKKESYMEEVSPTRALIGIAPTTLHHLPHQRQQSYEKIRKLTMAVPVVQWNIGTDPYSLTKSFYEINVEA